METKYVAANEASKEVVWLRKFYSTLEVIPGTMAIVNTKDSRHQKSSKHIDKKYHIIRGFAEIGDMAVIKIASEYNLVDPFIKTLVARSFERHI